MEKLILLLIFLNFAVSNTAYGKSGEMFIFILPLRFSAYPFVKSLDPMGLRLLRTLRKQ